MQQTFQGVTTSGDMSGEVISHIGYQYYSYYDRTMDKTFTVTGLSTHIVYCLLLEFERFSVSNSYSSYGVREYAAAQCEYGDVLQIKARKYCNSPGYLPQTGRRFSQLVSNADSISFRFRTDYYYTSTGFSFEYTGKVDMNQQLNLSSFFYLSFV